MQIIPDNTNAISTKFENTSFVSITKQEFQHLVIEKLGFFSRPLLE